jgi:phage gp46-like protein
MADPRIILSADGARLQFSGGQPLLDHGLENLVLISLFSAPGWVGNRFMVREIGSDFEEACNQPITRQSLERIRNAAERALALTILGKVTVEVSNPNSYRLDVRVGSVCLTRNNGTWSFQANDPAYRKVTG